MEMLQGVWKQHLRPRAVVGYGIKIFLPSPPNYVTRSPGLCYAGYQVNRMICKLVTLQRMGWSSFHVSCRLATSQLRGFGTSSHLLGNLLTKNVEQSPTKRMVDILGQDDSSHRYPYIYLRDNCPCSDCYFRDSSQHLLDTVREVDLNIIPDKVEINNDGTEPSITWPNGHVSLFDSD